MRPVREQLPEPTIRLLAATDWWIALLDAVATRMSDCVGSSSWRQFLERHPREQLERYLTLEEIESGLDAATDPAAMAMALQADALFVASALYQVNGFLTQLAKLPVWRGPLASAGSRYREIYKASRLKDLRDVIEHADEHIALEKTDIASDFDSGLGTRVWGRATGQGVGPAVIHLFGNEYDVLAAIEAARALRPHVECEIPESMRREPPGRSRARLLDLTGQTAPVTFPHADPGKGVYSS